MRLFIISMGLRSMKPQLLLDIIENDNLDAARHLITTKTAFATLLDNMFYFIHVAAQKNRFEIIQIILEIYPELLNQVDKFNQTPLLWAVSKGHVEIVNYLISKDADLNRPTHRPGSEDHGKTPLDWAFQGKHNTVICELIRAGADIQKLTNGKHYIHLAAEQGQLNVVQTLVEKCPKLLNQVDKLDQTPLLWAAGKGHVEIVNYLISKDADLNRPTHRPGHVDHGKTPIDWALQFGHQEIVNILTVYGRKSTKHNFIQLIAQSIFFSTSDTPKSIVAQEKPIAPQTNIVSSALQIPQQKIDDTLKPVVSTEFISRRSLHAKRLPLTEDDYNWARSFD